MIKKTITLERQRVMDLKDIRTLIKMVDDSGVDEVRLEQDQFKIVIKKNKGVQMMPASYAPAPIAMAPPSAPTPTQAPTPKTETTSTSKPETSSANHEVKSPIVGTYYSAPAPDAAPYVKVGDKINVGDVLCIIEAMKLMNEIESDVSGKVLKILVENGKPIEFNQPLFLIEKD